MVPVVDLSADSAKNVFTVGTGTQVEQQYGSSSSCCWPLPGSKILPYVYNSNILRTNMIVFQVDTVPHGVGIPT